VIGLDTNVVVRYLTQDDPPQCQAVNDLLERTARSDEVAWVLDSVYRYARAEIANALTLLLAVRQIQVERRQAIKSALDAFASGEADFADYLISTLNREQGCEATLTFDKKAAACVGFSLLAG